MVVEIRHIFFTLTILLMTHGLTTAATNAPHLGVPPTSAPLLPQGSSAEAANADEAFAQALAQRRVAAEVAQGSALVFTETLRPGPSMFIGENVATAMASAVTGENGNGTWLAVLTPEAEWDTRHSDEATRTGIDGPAHLSTILNALLDDPERQNVATLKAMMLGATALGFTTPEDDAPGAFYPGPLNVIACRIANQYTVIPNQQPCPQYWVGVLADTLRDDKSFAARWMQSLLPASDKGSAERLDTKKGRCTVDRSGYVFDGGMVQPNAVFDYEISASWSNTVPAAVTVTIDLTPMRGQLKPVRAVNSNE